MPANIIKSESESERIVQHSPLLTLSPEIRLLIYSLALQHTVDEIRAQNTTPAIPRLRGALALLHTSSLLRAESSKAFNFLVQLESFQVRRRPGWKDLADMANARVGSSEWKEIVGRKDLMRDVRGLIVWVFESVQGPEER
jgi:hypothetical protein